MVTHNQLSVRTESQWLSRKCGCLISDLFFLALENMQRFDDHLIRVLQPPSWAPGRDGSAGKCWAVWTRLLGVQ